MTTTPHPTDSPAAPRPARRRVARAVGFTALALAAAIVACDVAGWPFLAEPAQRWLTERLQRPVSFDDPGELARAASPNARPVDAADPAGARSEAARIERFALHLIGPIRLQLPGLTIGAGETVGAVAAPAADAGKPAAPDVQPSGPLVQGRALAARLRWSDLIGWRSGRPLPLDSVRADTLHLNLRRMADGQANWQFDTEPRRAGERPTVDGVTVRRLAVRDGHLAYADAPLQIQMAGPFSWREATETGTSADTASSGTTASAAAPIGLHAEFEGRYQRHPMTLSVQTGSTRAWWEAGADRAAAVPVQALLTAGRARLAFFGTLSGELADPEVQGRYGVSGPSLAAVGAPFGLVLPTTHVFSMAGRLHRAGLRWSTVVDVARIGDSELDGAFVFQQAEPGTGQQARLDGRLHSNRLALADLGPTLGTTAADDGSQPWSRKGRVLPQRPLDLPSLKAMAAQVDLRFERLDTGTTAVREIAPLQARLALADGVLRLTDIDARAARGHLTGTMQLDAVRQPARWDADLRLRGLDLDRWLPLLQRDGQKPWASGLVDAALKLRGNGRSVAQVLGTAEGRASLLWRQGTLSHLAIEAVGLDVAQALGVGLIKGDQPLPVNCGYADVIVSGGEFTPAPLVVDTRDTVLAVGGRGSLADERLALELKAHPKDFSPLALRTPIRVDGPFAAPQVHLKPGPLLAKAGAAVVLGTAVAPLAALLPLADLGVDDETRQLQMRCSRAMPPAPAAGRAAG